LVSLSKFMSQNMLGDERAESPTSHRRAHEIIEQREFLRGEIDLLSPRETLRLALDLQVADPQGSRGSASLRAEHRAHAREQLENAKGLTR